MIAVLHADVTGGAC